MSVESLEGRVVAVIYLNEDNGYAVVKIETEEGIHTTAVGCLPHVAPGELIEGVGHRTNHAVYGEQFNLQTVERRLPETEAGIFTYLSSGVIRGLGAASAKLLIDAFGEKTLEVIGEGPAKLAGVKGISPKKAVQIHEDYTRQHGLRKLMELLRRHGIQPQMALRVMQRYGAGSVAAVQDNPYVLTDPEIGVRFLYADAMALSGGIEPGDSRRLQAALINRLQTAQDSGHCYLPCGELLRDTAKLLGESEPQMLRSALESLLQSGRLICEESALSDGSPVFLYELYRAEAFVADALRRRIEIKPLTKKARDTLRQQLHEIEEQVGIQYAPAQKRAVELAAQSGVMLLTGGPGTGKTTVVKAMLRLFRRQRLHIALAAPTGRAAKRLSEVADEPAGTLHRLLEFGPDPDSGQLRFLRDAQRPLEADVVIVDETSMVDILLMHSLTLALKPAARLILVGDPDQLPSVGAGQVLEDLIRSDALPMAHLDEIFRQEASGGIIIESHAVNHGKLPRLDNKRYEDYFFVKADTPELISMTVVDLCAHRLPKAYGLEPSMIQVLTPTRKGLCGTGELNRSLQQVINPPSPLKPEKPVGSMLLRLGDRVMQTRNNYNLLWRDEKGITENGIGVFNGEIGVIDGFDGQSETAAVRFDDHWVDYPYDSLIELELAYALTVHKSQGSEYPAVVMVMGQAPAPLMTRRVLYTAMTRARSRLVMVGLHAAMGEMVRNDRRARRYTMLAERLISPEAALV